MYIKFKLFIPALIPEFLLTINKAFNCKYIAFFSEIWAKITANMANTRAMPSGTNGDAFPVHHW